MTTIEIVTLIANISFALSFLIALVFGITQVRAAARDRKEGFTLETLSNFQSREFSELLIFINNDKIPTTLAEWETLPKKDQILLLQFSQTMESLGIIVAEQYVNINLVDKTIGSVVTSSWEKLQPWISEAREKIPDPYLNEYFQWLAERLEEKMKTSSRKPFYQKSYIY